MTLDETLRYSMEEETKLSVPVSLDEPLILKNPVNLTGQGETVLYDTERAWRRRQSSFGDSRQRKLQGLFRVLQFSSQRPPSGGERPLRSHSSQLQYARVSHRRNSLEWKLRSFHQRVGNPALRLVRNLSRRVRRTDARAWRSERPAPTKEPEINFPRTASTG